MKIASTKNPQIKTVKKYLDNARARTKDQIIILDGDHLVQEYQTQFPTTPIRCFITESFLKSPTFPKLNRSFDELEVVENHVMNHITPTKTPSGIVALAPMPQIKKENPKNLNNIILLENIQDPGNLGTIFRTARASGFQDVFLSQDCTDPYSPKCLRAGMGAQFKINIQTNHNLSEVVKSFPGTIYGTSLQSDQSLYDIKWSERVGFVLANEGQGLSSELDSLLQAKFIIPMVNDTESLNVAMAATVVCFEYARSQKR